MASSLVLDLRQDAMDSSISVSQLLRKALALATKLDVDEFRIWAQKALNGYETELPPTYREVHGEIRADDPYHGSIPVIFQDTRATKMLSSKRLRQPISELEDLLSR